MKQKFTFLLILLFSFSVAAYAQNHRISGVVVSAEDNSPIPGATLVVEGTTTGTNTDRNGQFNLSVPNNGTVLVEFLGMRPERFTVTEAMTNLRIVLDSEVNEIDDVVVIAYGTATRESVTGAISSVSADMLEKRTSSSVAAMLEGNVTGLTVTSGGGAGSAPAIRIRGYTSVTGGDEGNQPLYVVDGVPMPGNVQDINPQDVENISVLKDAAAAALYGNRASNGVIIITTKKGKSQNGANVRVTVNQGFYKRAIPDYDYMNADEFMETMWRGYYNYTRSNPTEAAKYTDAEASAFVTKNLVADKLKYNIYNKPGDALFDANGKLVSDASIRPGYDDLDWWKEMERTGHRQEYHISADAASEKNSYYISAGYLNEQGYVTNDQYERFTAKANVTLTPKRWLTLRLNLEGSHQIENVITTGSGSASAFYSAKFMAPIYPIYEHDQETGNYILDANGDNIYDDGSGFARPQHLGRNVILETQLNKNKQYRTTLGSTGSVSVKFLKDFTFNLMVNASIRNQEQKQYDNSLIGDGQGANGRAGGTTYRYLTITAQQQLNWKRSFDLHNVDAMVVHENYQNGYDYKYYRVADETFFGQWDMINFNSYTSLYGYENNVRTESYLGRVRYNYDNKYFLEASMRRDGSSRFHPDHRWGNFWSFGGSWSIHRESFMLPYQDKINSLRLRASYGEVGNDRGVDRYAYMGLYTLVTNANTGGAYKSQNEATNISWESAVSWGVALSGRLYDRVNFEVEYFSKESHDMLFDVEMPLSVGSISASTIGARQTINQGNMANRGIEFNVDVDVINKPDLNWNVSASGTYIKNKITKLPEQMIDYIDGNRIRQIGKPFFNWYLRDFAGVDQMTGRALFHIDDEAYPDGIPDSAKEFEVEINGTKYSTHYTYAKKSYFGDAMPNFYGSIGTSLQWKNLSLSVLCTYSFGGKMMDSRYNTLMSVSETPHAYHRDLLKAWNGVPVGMTETSANRIDPKGTPAPDFYYYNYSTLTHQGMLQDMTYFSLRNINLSYNLPRKWLQAIDLSSATVSLGVENLWMSTTLKGMNPQQNFDGTSSYSFDTNRIVSLGLNVRF